MVRVAAGTLPTHLPVLQSAITGGWFDQLIFTLAPGCQEAPGIGTGVLTDAPGSIAGTVAVAVVPYDTVR